MRRFLFTLVSLFALTTACAAPASPAPATPPPAAPSSQPASRVPPRGSANTTLVPGTIEGTRPLSRTPSREPNTPTLPRPTAAPTLTPSPVPSPTPVPAQLVRLLDGGCCASPGWYSDSQTVLFIDKPAADAPVGLYKVDINAPQESELWSERIAFYTREFDYAQIPEQAGTRIIRVSDGKELRVRNGGRQVSFSPDRTRVVWTETRETFPIENRVSNIMLAPVDFDGAGVGEAKRVTQVLRGGVSGWLDDNRLLMNGRLSRDTEESTTLVYDLTSGEQTVVFTAERSRLTSVSRDGSWIAYVIVNDKDATRNGLWVSHTDGTSLKKVDLFGAAQWRDGARLIIAPFEMNAPTHAFYEYNAETGETRRLTPASQPFKIASGDWSVSPDGNKIVFVNAADNNLWLWKLPE